MKTSNIGTSSITIGLRDRAYGGPEEGGWYYDTFEPVRVFTVPARAYERLASRLAKWLVCANRGRRPISSVLSEGIYEIRDGVVGHEPKERPYYE